VHVKGVELRAHPHDVPLHRVTDLGPENRRVADECAAVDRLEAVERVEDDDELTVGQRLTAGAYREHAVHAPAIDSVIDGEWSWYGHAPDDCGPAVKR